MPGIREPVGEGADRLGAAGHDERVDLEEAGGARAGPGWSRRRRSAGEATTTRADARDLRRHDGHDQRRRDTVPSHPGRSAPTRSIGDHRRSISIPGAIGRGGRRRSLGLGEARGRWRSPGRGPGGSVATGRSRAARRSAGSRTSRPSGRPPPNASLAARTAASPPSRTAARVRLAASRIAGSGTAPRRTSAA